MWLFVDYRFCIKNSIFMKEVISKMGLYYVKNEHVKMLIFKLFIAFVLALKRSYINVSDASVKYKTSETIVPKVL